MKLFIISDRHCWNVHAKSNRSKLFSLDSHPFLSIRMWFCSLKAKASAPKFSFFAHGCTQIWRQFLSNAFWLAWPVPARVGQK